jgi:antitoxin VapB
MESQLQYQCRLAGGSWDDWFDGPGVSNDFLASREQPADQERESL